MERGLCEEGSPWAWIPVGRKRRGMTAVQLIRLRKLIEDGCEERFYSWQVWRRLSHTVRTRIDRNECQACKRRGKYAPAEIVHHVKHLQDRPDLALSIYDPETGE